MAGTKRAAASCSGADASAWGRALREPRSQPEEGNGVRTGKKPRAGREPESNPVARRSPRRACPPEPAPAGRAARGARRSLLRRLVSLPRGFAAALLALAAGAAQAAELVSNTTLTSSTGSSAFQAQSFETGDNSGGYTISEIVISQSSANAGETTVVTIREDTSDEPGNVVATFMNPTTVSTGLNTFTAPDDTTLTAETTYWVSVNDGVSDRIAFHHVSEDTQTGASGWSIGDDRLWRTSESNSWSTENRSLIMRINGELVAGTAPNPPTALEAVPYGHDAVLLSWTAPATGATPTGYKVEVSADSGVNWTDAEDDTGNTDTSWIHEGLMASATRHYRVSALASGESSNPSATASATTCAEGVLWCPTLTVGNLSTLYGYSDLPPVDIGSLAPDSFTRGTAVVGVPHLAYASGAGGQLSLQIRRISGTTPADGLLGSEELALTLGSETFTFTAGLGSQLVFLFDDPGLSWNDGDTVEVSLALAPPTAPNPPTALEAVPYGHDAVLLTWTAPATGTTPTGYKVEVSDDGTTDWTDAEDDTESTDTSWIHEGLMASATRHYRVSSVASGTASTPSATDSATTCAAGVPWCPTMTAGTLTTVGPRTFTGFSTVTAASLGSLSPASFRHGGSTYTSDTLTHGDLGGGTTNLVLSFESALPTALDGFALRSGSQERSLASATYSASVFSYAWSDPPFGPWTDGQEVAFELAAANNPATGAPTISGTARVGETLTAATAGIMDTDGLMGVSYTYQWIREDSNGMNPVEIGTDSSTYVLVAADEGKKIKVRVSFQDDEGNDEALTSAAYPSGMETVAAAPVQTPTDVSADWSLIPSGLSTGEDFRLLIVTSTQQIAAATAIASYNTVVQGDVSGTGHTDIQAYSAGFRMLGCTETVSAITNTNTASTDTAAPIYWLNGAKVADDYTDLYDGSWDSNAPKYPAGTNAPTSGSDSQTFTGCTETGASRSGFYLGAFAVVEGSPGISGSELDANSAIVSTASLRFYGLSEIFRVSANTVATGAPTISGTVEVGQTLTAAIGNIADIDGLPETFPDDYSFQWIRVNSDGSSDPEDIAGASASTYRLVAADEGKRIRVRVGFADDEGTPEARTGDATAVVVPPSACTTGNIWCATLTVAVNPLHPPSRARGYCDSASGRCSTGYGGLSDTDFDLDSTTYTVESVRWGASSEPGARSLHLTLDRDFPDAGLELVTLRVGSHFFAPGSARRTISSANVANNYAWPVPAAIRDAAVGAVLTVELLPNAPATGAPTVAGTAEVGETLTASKGMIADADGLTRADSGEAGHAYTYQWIRVDADGSSNPRDISGASGSTYVLGAADEGKRIRVRVGFADDGGTPEARTSDAYPSGTETVNAGPTDVLWSATLTVGNFSTIYGYSDVPPVDIGSLSPASFTRGTAVVGVPYLAYSGELLTLQIRHISGTIPADGLLGSEELELTLGSETFTFTAGVGSQLVISFDPAGLSWNDGDTVEVSLALTPAPAPAPEITIEPDRPKAAARHDYIHYTLTREGPATEALTVPVTLVGPDGNDWGLRDETLGYEVPFGAGESTARLIIRLAPYTNGVIFAGSATAGGTLVASLGDVIGYDTTDTAEVEVVLAPDPMWIARLVQNAYSFDEGGGAQDVEIEVYATSADLPAPSSAPDGGASFEVSFSTDEGTALPIGPLNPNGDYTSTANMVKFPTSAFSAGADGLQRARITRTFTPAQDSLVEGDETMAFALERAPAVGIGRIAFDRPDGTRGGDASYPATIVDDDFGVLDVAVTSTPGASADTYGVGDEIRFTATFSQPATVTGSPHFEFSLGASGSEVTTDAAYARGSGTTELVFAYTVQSGDMDTDGISVGDGATTIMFDTGEHIRNAVNTDATLTHDAPGTLVGHKVDGSTSPSGAPTAPDGLEATAVGANRIDLSWNLPSSIGASAITGYRIERSDDGEDPWTELQDDTETTARSYRDTDGLSAETTRYYRVSAINGEDTGPASNVAFTTTVSGVPGAPTGLTATKNADNPGTQIDLDWDAPTDMGTTDITGYKIEWSANGNDPWEVLEANHAVMENDEIVTAYSDSGLPSPTTRYYRVSARNDAGAGTPSSVVSETTDDTAGPVLESATVASDGQSLTLITDESVFFATNNQPAGLFELTADGVRIGIGGVGDFRLTSLGNRRVPLLTNLSPSIKRGQTVVLTYTDPNPGSDDNLNTGVIEDQANNDMASYTTGQNNGVYEVPAVANNSDVDPVPGAPTGLTATKNADNPGTQIDLDWDAPTDMGTTDITGYKIEWSANGNDPWEVLEANHAVMENDEIVTAYSDSGLPSPTTRYYRVSARNDAGAGTPSSVVSETTDDTAGPVLESATVASDGQSLTLITDESVFFATNNQPAGLFELTADGVRIGIGGVGDFRLTSLGNRHVPLLTNLSPSIKQGQTVVLTYTDPNPGSDDNLNTGVIEDEANNDMASYTTGQNNGVYEVPAVANNSNVDPVVPGAPLALAAEPGEDRVVLTWDPPADNGGRVVASYRMEWSANGGDPWGEVVDAHDTMKDGAIERRYEEDGLSPATTRHYRIRAKNAIGDGAWSAALETMTTSGAPGAPTGLTATAGLPTTPDGTTLIRLDWEEPASQGESDITGYQIEWSDDGNPPWNPAMDTGTRAVRYTDTGLGSETTRFYRVRATNDDGTGMPSNTDSATTADVAGPVPLSASAAASGTSLEIVFNEALDAGALAGAQGRFEVSAADGARFTVGGVDVSGMNLTLNLASGAAVVRTGQAVTVVYTDRTANDDTAGVVQDELDNDAAAFTLGPDATVTVANDSTQPVVAPGVPEMLLAPSGGGDRIVLIWTPPADTGGALITGYLIESSADGVSFETLVANHDTMENDRIATEYMDTGLSVGQVRHYRVRARNGPDEADLGSFAEAMGVVDPKGEVAVSVSPASVDEGRTATWTVTATTDEDERPGNDFELVVQVASEDGTAQAPDDYEALVETVTFTRAHFSRRTVDGARRWVAERSGRIAIADDVEVEAEKRFSVTVEVVNTAASEYFAATPRAEVAIADDDEWRVVVVADPASVAEGETREVTLTARIVPQSADCVVPFAVTVGLAVSGTATAGTDYTLGGTTPAQAIAACAADTSWRVTLAAGLDADDDGGETVTFAPELTGTPEIAPAALTAAAVTLRETPGVTLGAFALDIVEGDSATYTAVLTSRPTGTVRVRPSVSGDMDVTVSPPVLTFRPGDWNVVQTVRVLAGQDADDEDDAAEVSHAVTGAGYGGVTAGTVRVAVEDDEGSAGVMTVRLSDGSPDAGTKDPAPRVHFGPGAPFRIALWWSELRTPEYENPTLAIGPERAIRVTGATARPVKDPHYPNSYGYPQHALTLEFTPDGTGDVTLVLEPLECSESGGRGTYDRHALCARTRNGGGPLTGLAKRVRWTVRGIAAAPRSPDNLTVSTQAKQGREQLLVSFDADEEASAYEVQVKRTYEGWNSEDARRWTGEASGETQFVTVEEISHGYAYDVRAQWTNPIGAGPWATVSTGGAPAPAAPTALSVRQNDDGHSVSLAWTPPGGSDVARQQYRLSRFPTYIDGASSGDRVFRPDGWKNIPDSGNNGTNVRSYTVEGLANTWEIEAEVRAVSASGRAGAASEAGRVPETAPRVLPARTAMASGPGGDGYYAAGDRIVVGVRMSRPVRLRDGSPSPLLRLRVGDTTHAVPLDRIRQSEHYLGILATPRLGDTLYFAFTVPAGAADADGVSIPANGLDLNGGQLIDVTFGGSYGPATLSLPQPRHFPRHKVQAVVPGVERIEWHGNRVWVRYDRDLDPFSGIEAALSQFGVDLSGSTPGSPPVTEARIIRDRGWPHRCGEGQAGCRTMRLTLEEVQRGQSGGRYREPEPGETVRVSYTPSPHLPQYRLRDRFGNEAPAFGLSEARHLGVAGDPLLSVSDGSGTEGTDDAVVFVVTLVPAATAEVRVDYATRDGTATAPADYEETSDTLTFEPGETRKTIAVPIEDDEIRDSGERFTLSLGNPSGAGLARGEGTGTIRNTEEDIGVVFGEMPERHDGSGAFSFRLEFDKEFPVSAETLREAALDVTGGAVTAASRLDPDSDRYWEIAVEPDSDGDVTIILERKTCDAPGAICAEDGRRIVRPVRAVVRGPAAGPVAVAPYVTAVTVVADGSGDRKWVAGERIEVRLTFSEAVTVSDGPPWPWIDVTFAGWRLPVPIPYVSGSGSPDAVFSTAVPAGAAGFTGLAVLADSLAANGADIVSQASGIAADLRHDATEPTAAPGTGEPSALTAQFLDLPENGHGGNAFTFRLRFSEEFPLSYVTLLESAFQVGNGTVSAVRRATPGNDRAWDITVTPAGAGAVTVTLPRTTDCEAAGAICAGDGRKLSAPVEETVPETVEEAVPEAPPLQVRLVGFPGEHAGTGEIVFTVEFTKEPDAGYSYTTLLGSTLNIRRGATRLTPKVRRLNPPHNDRWEVRVAPGSDDDVTVSIGPFSLCTDTGAVCTADGEVLANEVSETILGPRGLSVADARVDEAEENATLDFAVTLARASPETVSVGYATADGTATADEDYEPKSGTLTFLAGETSKTVSVAVLDDGHDEGEQTLTLRLANAAGGNAYLADAEATGTIANSDPMPKGWLARFGRTASVQTVDAIRERLAGGPRRAEDNHFTVGGRRVDQLLSEFRDAARSADAKETGDGAGPDRRLEDESAWERMDRLKAESMRWGTAPGGTGLVGSGLAGGGIGLAGGESAGGTPRMGGPAPTGLSSSGASPSGSNDAGLPSAGLSPAVPPSTGVPSAGLLSEARAGLENLVSAGLSSAGLPFAGLPFAGLLSTARPFADLLSRGREDWRALLMGSSFDYSRTLEDGTGTANGLSSWSAWGRAAETRFSGADGKLSIDGAVATATVGADARWGRWLAGVAVSHSFGEGAYTHASAGGGGELTSRLTSVNPYANFDVNERLSLWGRGRLWRGRSRSSERACR